jgi:uncharacterized protein YggU (UPF0235/DUF167 family)
MYVKVEVVPKSRKETVTHLSPNKLKITVREPAQQNLANRRIQQILSTEFGVSVAQVKLLTGHRSSGKMYSIEKND